MASIIPVSPLQVSAVMGPGYSKKIPRDIYERYLTGSAAESIARSRKYAKEAEKLRSEERSILEESREMQEEFQSGLLSQQEQLLGIQESSEAATQAFRERQAELSEVQQRIDKLRLAAQEKTAATQAQLGKLGLGVQAAGTIGMGLLAYKAGLFGGGAAAPVAEMAAGGLSAAPAAATPALAYAAPAVPGFAVGAYMAGKGGTSTGEARRVGVATGAATGAAIGTWVFPGIGTGIGAAIGAAGSLLGVEIGKGGGLCAIVTACEGIDSHSVKITRQYRDKYLDNITVKGYYKLAKLLVPVIRKSNEFRKYIINTLIHPLVDYGEWQLGYKDEMDNPMSLFISMNFLDTCYFIGVQNE